MATAKDADFPMSCENTASPCYSPRVCPGRTFGVNGLHTNEMADQPGLDASPSSPRIQMVRYWVSFSYL